MSKTQQIWIAIVLVVVIGVFVGWRVYEGQQSSGPIKIGVATILSGDWASLGENIVNTADLTVDQINAAGGVNGRMLEVVSQDSGIDGPTGLSAVSELINIEGVHYIVGGMASNGTDAAAPILNQDHVDDLTPVTGGKDVDNDGEYVFRTATGEIQGAIPGR